ncbi:MAG: PTS sugar transporter subunit IIA [Pseudomonadales bacterium]|nr:PTS sugar transporter subunit IIA [Pseudomonadales bacterium]
MNIDEILSPDRTCSTLSPSSKKKAIEFVSEKISSSLPTLRLRHIYRGLIEREKLGTTAIGEGVALPHCRLPKCEKIVGGLFVFDDPIDFSAPDERGVNILFTLLVPEHETSEHLKTLSMLAQGFSNPDTRQLLLDARSDEKLYQAALTIGTSP